MSENRFLMKNMSKYGVLMCDFHITWVHKYLSVYSGKKNRKQFFRAYPPTWC